MNPTRFFSQNSKNVPASVIDTALVILIGIFLILFPLVISSNLTNPFLLPKQLIVLIFMLLVLVLWGVKMIVEGRILIRRTPLDVPALVFMVILFLSSIVSINRYDSLFAFVAFFPLVLAYFLIVNIARKKEVVLFLFSSWCISGVFL